MAVLIGRLGVFAIPVAFAALAVLEAIALGVALAVKLRRRAGAARLPASA
jgi:hypothetical protein